MFRLAQRHILAVMGFLGMLNVYMCRLNFNIAIVAMAGDSPQANGTSQCPDRGYLESIEEGGEQGEFDWKPSQKGTLIGCYFWGYILTNIPGGWCAQHYGFKKVLGISIFISSFLTLLTPLAAVQGFDFLKCLRIAIGFCHGVSFPTMHAAWTHWAPPKERSKLVSIAIAGSSVGSVLIYPLAAVLSDTLGWRSIFYFTGGLSLVWCLAWAFLVFDSPAVHPRISAQELELISASLEEERSTVQDAGGDKKTPWKSILTSVPVWACCIAQLASNWGNYLLNSMLPTYYQSILRFSIKMNGILSAVPFAAQSLVCFFAGWATDRIRSRNLMSTIAVRKLNTAIGLLVPAVTVMLASYMGCNAWPAVGFFVLSAGFNTFTVPGVKTSMLDYAPRYSGVIFGVCNTVSNLSGFLAPQTTGKLLDADSSIEGWRTAFWVSAAVYVPGFLVFQLLGTDQLQDWAKA